MKKIKRGREFILIAAFIDLGQRKLRYLDWMLKYIGYYLEGSFECLRSFMNYQLSKNASSSLLALGVLRFRL